MATPSPQSLGGLASNPAEPSKTHQNQNALSKMGSARPLPRGRRQLPRSESMGKLEDLPREIRDMIYVHYSGKLMDISSLYNFLSRKDLSRTKTPMDDEHRESYYSNSNFWFNLADFMTNQNGDTGRARQFWDTWLHQLNDQDTTLLNKLTLYGIHSVVRVSIRRRNGIGVEFKVSDRNAEPVVEYWFDWDLIGKAPTLYKPGGRVLGWHRETAGLMNVCQDAGRRMSSAQSPGLQKHELAAIGTRAIELASVEAHMARPVWVEFGGAGVK